MSQPTKGKRQPAKAGRAHSDKNAGGASGDKKGAEAQEKKPASASAAEAPKTQTSGSSAMSKAQASSAVASKAPIMKSSETKAAQKSKAESEKAAQSAKLEDSEDKRPSEEKQRDPAGAKSPSKPSVAVEAKQPSAGKVASGKTEKLAELTSKEEPKAKPDRKPLTKAATIAAIDTSGAEKVTGLPAGSAETKESKLATTSPAADSKPSEKSDLDTALDDLIDTLGGPEENEPPTPAYSGPDVSERVSSIYIEELGKREGSIPPKYRKLLESKGDDKDIPPPEAVGEPQPSMTDDDLADALSSDFTCSAAVSAGEKTDMPKEKSAEGDLLQAQTTNLVSSSAPPKEKKAKLEEVAVSDSALDALVDTLGMPEPEPEVDLSSITEVEEPKAKERKEKKAGEHDDTIPPEYRLKPVLDKDGKPILPKPEEKPKPLSESDLIDEFSKDFACPTAPIEAAKPSKPDEVPKKAEAVVPPKIPEEKAAASPKAPSGQSLSPSGVSTKATATETKGISTEEVVSAATIQPAQSSAPAAASLSTHVPDEALEALSGSLGKRELDSEEKKPAVDKVKEKTKQENREKLGEDEETIPPDYRLTETKDKDGKPLLPKPEEKPKPLNESDLLDALSEGFSCSSAPTSKASPQGSASVTKPAVVSTEEVVPSASAPAVHSSAPTTTTIPGGKELDAAADLLADSLGQREPDPDENKPLVDKIKEKAKSEHREKLGERDDTIPPDYRHILDSDGKDKPRSTDGNKPKELKKPADDSAAIDALSGDFDHCEKPPGSQKPSAKEEKTKEVAAPKPARKDEKKAKTPKKAKEQSSSGKSEKQKKS